MEAKTVIIGIIAGIMILTAVSFAAANLFFMNQASDDIGDPLVTPPYAACNSTLETMKKEMNESETRKIPESCFTEGEIRTNKLPDAEPGDSFRKTSTGITTAP